MFQQDACTGETVVKPGVTGLRDPVIKPSSNNSLVVDNSSTSPTTKPEDSKQEVGDVFSQVTGIVPSEQQDIPTEGYQNRERQNKFKKSKKKDVWFCADPGCKRENLKHSDSCEQCGLSVKMTKDYQGRKRGGRNWNRGGGGRKGGGWNRGQGEWRNKVNVVDSDDPVQNMFGEISKVLDYRHDKRERIVKISRDITIESKRIIFCLHRIKGEDDKAAVLGEAEGRFWDMKDKLWYYLARELKGEDHYQFIKAYSSGLQEWVEALSFYHYLAYDKLISFDEVEKELLFEDKKAKRKVDKIKEGDIMDELQEENTEEKQEIEDKDDSNVLSEQGDGEKDTVKEAGEHKDLNADENFKDADDVSTNMDGLAISEKPNIIITVTVPQSEYILGLADLTGELMRNAINSLGSGNLDVCFVLLDILQSMAAGFGRLPKHETPREIGHKLYTLKQSCRKVENACYAISVRGSEIPKTHLADIFTNKRDEEFMEDLPEGEGDNYFFD